MKTRSSFILAVALSAALGFAIMGSFAAHQSSPVSTIAAGPISPPDDGDLIAAGPISPPDDGDLIAAGPISPPDDGDLIAAGPISPPDDGDLVA